MNSNPSNGQSQRTSYFDEFDLDLTQENWLEIAEAAHSQAQAKHEELRASQAYVKYEAIDESSSQQQSVDLTSSNEQVYSDSNGHSPAYQDHSPHVSISQFSSHSHLSSPQPPSQSPEPSQHSEPELHYSPVERVDEYGETVLQAPCVVQPRTAWDMLHSPEDYPVLCTGLPEFDRMLRGGLRTGINEIVGEAGAAKSQLCFQLLLQVQLPLPPRDYFMNQPFEPTASEFGLDGCALYIGTEGEIPIARISAIQRGMYKRIVWTHGYDYMGGIFPVRVQSLEELQTLLTKAQETIVEKNIRLIVIDSIAGLLRVNETDEANHASSRVEGMFELAATLKKISTMYRCIVVVANQVTDRVRQEDAQTGFSVNGSHYLDSYTIESSGREMIPSLGISWASCVNTRLVLTRSGGARGHGEALTRFISVGFSPHCRNKQRVPFEVTEEGIV